MQNVSSSNSQAVNVPKLRFPGFEEGWTTSNIGDIGSFFKGAPLSKADISENGTPFILYGELYTTYDEVATSIKRKTEAIVSDEYISEVGDVIIPTSGETPEDIATATCVMTPGVILAGDLCIMRNPQIDGRFLSYEINHKAKYKIARIAQGKSIVHIRPDEIERISINYPKKTEQEKILKFLDLLTQKIEKQQALVEALKLYKRGVLKREIESYGQTEFAIKEIVNEYVEKVDSTSTLPILSSTMSGIFLQEAYFNKQAASEDISGYKVVPYGYFTYRSMSDTGKFRFNIQTIVDCGIVSPAYPVFIVKKNNNPRYVEYILNESDYIKNQLLILKEGGTRYALSYTKFLKLNIQLPSIDIQNKIAKQIELFDDLIIRYETILQELYKLKSSLLQQMFI